MDRALLINCIPRAGDYLKRALYAGPISEREILSGRISLTGLIPERGSLCFDPDELTGEYARIRLWLESSGARFVAVDSEFYPPLLRYSRYAPFALFAKGREDINWKRCLCAVGTRRPANASRTEAYRFGLECALNGVTLVSGYASGLDQDLMQGALDGGGQCVGIPGCGLDAITSPRALGMIGDLCRQGAVMSPFSPDTPGYKSNYPRRNLILAACTPVVVAFQAPLSSGVRITCNAALEEGRDVVVHSSALIWGDCRGTREIAGEGAPVVDGVRDLFTGAENRVRRLDYVPGSIPYPVVPDGAKLYRFRDAWYISGDENERGIQGSVS